MEILLADMHLAPFRAEKFLTQEKNIMEAAIQFFAKRFENKNKEAKMLARMRKTIRKKNITVGIFNGDFAESSRTERGMNTQRDLQTISKLKDETRKILGLEFGEYNMGNHESGYDLPMGTDSERGINWAAIKNFLVFAGWKDLYHSFTLDGCKIIFVPYIFSEEKARDFDLAAEKKKFLASMAQDLTEDIPVVLFVHDPDSFDDPQLISLIRNNRLKIKHILYGHYHSWINLLGMRIMSSIYSDTKLIAIRRITDKVFLKLAKGNIRIVEEIGKYFRKRKNIPSIIKELGAILTPAPSGTFGIGGGYLVLDVEKGTVKKYRI